MSDQTAIQWTDVTWNPIAGCKPVSAGCAHCYAARMTRRLAAMGRADYHGLTTPAGFNGTVRYLAQKLEEPLHWRKPRRVFVCSMSDLFHEDVPFEFIEQVFSVMERARQHTFQVLTKRPKRMAEFVGEWWGPDPDGQQRIPCRHIWLGTSVENQQAADERIPHLLRCPAAVRFLSVEPMLGRVNLTDLQPTICGHLDALRGGWHKGDHRLYESASGKIGWVICGCESGPGARPFSRDWAMALRDQCAAAGVAFFLKQMPDPWRRGGVVTDVNLLPVDLRVREFPA